MATRNLRHGDWVSVRDAAAILHVSPKTLARWETEGRLTTHQIRIHRTLGGHRRYHRPDLEALARTLNIQVEEVR